MKKLVLTILLAVIVGTGIIQLKSVLPKKETPVAPYQKAEYWMFLKRRSNIEYLYYGIPGNYTRSTVVKMFTVKAGVPGKKPTPLPQLVGRDYWLITQKLESFDNEETAPYFLVLDVPTPSVAPFGPAPYTECNREQCNWEAPGYFGLHGVNGDLSRLTDENEGSSGCVRHKDEDITLLYHVLQPEKSPVRYYISDV